MAPFWPSSDHPRSRGEYKHSSLVAVNASGSSPLSRGIPTALDISSAILWIIPALAGNTPALVAPFWPSSDHPRSRGEYKVDLTQSEKFRGSSPLSRGIRCYRGVRASRRRIIPALAGNTAAGRSTTRRPGDHPRSRGEYNGIKGPIMELKGSSPLSRGIQLRPLGGDNRSRIIPALAGNTNTH